MITMHLALAGLKKKKSMTLTLVFLTFLAALFLNIGLILQNGLNTAYSSRVEALNSPDLFVLTDNMKYKTSFGDYLANDERTSYLEEEDVIYMESTENNITSLKLGSVILNKDATRTIAPLELVKEDSSVSAQKAIYLPIVLEGFGAALGEEYVITYKSISYSFEIAGFFETTYMGNSGSGYMKFFVPQERFQELYSKTSIGKFVSVKVTDNGLSPKETADSLKQDFLKDTNFYTKMGGTLAYTSCFSYGDMEGSILTMFTVPMVIMLAFAFLICVIVIIIVHLKVTEEIDESMPNIGSLQAMGYTPLQIMLSIMEQFIITGIIGSILGVLITYAIMPALMQWCSGATGILWNPGIHIRIDFLSIFLLLLLITASSYMATRKVKKIPPVIAFRKGMKTHHFGKNVFPLSKGNGSVYWRLALKNTVTNGRQNVTTAIVIGLGVFAIGIALTLYANFAYDRTAIVKMVGMEISDVQIKTLPNIEPEAFQKELEVLPEVEKTNATDYVMVKVDGEDVLTVVSDDFSKMEILAPVRGEFPLYDNEVVLTSTTLKSIHKDIGDTVNITTNGSTKEYLVTGVNMSTNNNGKMGILSLDGLHRLSPYHTLSQIELYLKEDVSIADFIEKLYALYGVADTSTFQNAEGLQNSKYAAAKEKAEAQIKKLLEQHGATDVSYTVMLDGEFILSGNSSSYKIKEITNMNDFLDGQLDSYAAMMSGLATAIPIVIFIIIGVIISITIKTFIRKQKEALGTYKALGYSTSELVKIISLTFTVNAVIGSLVGGILCQLSAGQLLQLFFSQLGLDMNNFSANPLWTCIVCIVVALYVSILSILSAYRVRKITVYELLTE